MAGLPTLRLGPLPPQRYLLPLRVHVVLRHRQRSTRQSRTVFLRTRNTTWTPSNKKGKFAGDPHYFGKAGELPGVREETECEGNNGGDPGSGMRRVNSITVRRQPSSVDFHSRTNPTTARAPPDGQHSRIEHVGSAHPLGPTATGSLPVRQPFPAQVQVTVPTVDGFFLEFNPLLVSPGALSELEGITEDAKKQAREEMVRLVKEAVSKWTI